MKRLEERARTGVFEVCLQVQRNGVGVLPVVALLVFEGGVSHKLISLFKIDA